MGRGRLAKIGLGVGAPLLAAVVWATFAAPDAAIAAPAAVRIGVQVAVFGLAGAVLATTRPALAKTLMLAALVNAALMAAWGQ